MKNSSLFDSFNARFLQPEEVARKFVPVPQFNELLRPNHCVLSGPRGCGKTTLLKMLTTGAQQIWASERKAEFTILGLNPPDFTAIYVPSDSRWSYELKAIDTEISTFSASPTKAGEIVQRLLVNCNALKCALDVFGRLIHCQLSDSEDAEEINVKVAQEITSQFKFFGVIPRLESISMWLDSLSAELRGVINRQNIGLLNTFFDRLSPIMYGAVVDPLILVCKIYSNIVPIQMKVNRWALCFDEVEISPQWLADELLASLRSVDQDFLLKITWSPVLPASSTSGPQEREDYSAVRLWSAYPVDQKVFCEQLCYSFLRSKFDRNDINPSDFLGDSVFSSISEDEKDVYDEGGAFEVAAKELVEKDRTFVSFLEAKGIFENNSIILSPDTQEKDKIFRKMKPLVLLRNEFNREDLIGRTRKLVRIYAGKQVTFAMSEGNPRWLLGLLSDLYERHSFVHGRGGSDLLPVDHKLQSVILSGASRRFQNALKSTPVVPEDPGYRSRYSVFAFVNLLTSRISERFFKRSFTLDPVGSITIKDGVSEDLLKVIRRAIDIGALVPIGSSPTEIPRALAGLRVRPSFLLSPAYKLWFRNYSSVELRELLDERDIVDQLEIKFDFGP